MEALTAQRRGDHKRAEDLYQQALMLDPGHVRALNNLGVLFMDQKKKREAVALFDRAIVLKKDYVDPYYNLACLYARMDEIDESHKVSEDGHGDQQRREKLGGEGCRHEEYRRL